MSEKLSEVQTRLIELTRRKQELYKIRMDEIKEGKLRPDPGFQVEIDKIDVETEQLWAEKRVLLSSLSISSELSWISPVIPVSEALLEESKTPDEPNQE